MRLRLHWYALITMPLLAAIGLAGARSKADSLSSRPEIFAPGVISTGANDGAPTFSRDGRTLYFERTNGRWAAILESRWIDGRWSRPVLAAFSGTTSDQQPALSPDGTYLIFVSSRAPLSKSGDGGAHVSHLYRVDRTRDCWTVPVELAPEVNISAKVFKPSIAANGDLYFMADVGISGPPRWRLFQARRQGNRYAAAEALSFSGPEDGDVDPFIAPDQSFLIFSSNTRGSRKDGHEHLFMVERAAQGWSAVREIRYDGDDSGADDGEAQVSPDGHWLYFTSSLTLPMSRVRDRQITIEGLERIELWDNGNNNVWRLPMSAIIDH